MPKASSPDLGSSHCQPTVEDRSKKFLSFPTGPTHVKMAQEYNISPSKLKVNFTMIIFWIYEYSLPVILAIFHFPSSAGIYAYKNTYIHTTMFKENR